MAYTRYTESGHYIYGGVDYVDFNGITISNDEIDVFIHNLFGGQGGGDADFWGRFYHGARIIDNFQRGIRIQTLTKYSYEQVPAAAIAALANEIWREHYTPIIGIEQVEYMLEKFQSEDQIRADIQKDNFVYFTAEPIKAHSLIGYCACQPKRDYLLLSKLYISGGYRKNGIARAFLAEAFALCRYEYSLDKVRLSVNKNNSGSIAAYRKMGFETVDSVKTDIGGGFYMDDFVMEAHVPSQVTGTQTHTQKPSTPVSAGDLAAVSAT